MDKRLVTLGKSASAELVEKKSVFIGYASPVSDEAEALDFVAKIKKKHADARHNVYAYMLNEGACARYSDDGEPQGTAGIPVLDIIRKGGFSDAVIVVSSILPARDPAFELSSKWYEIPDFSAAIAEACAENGVVFVDNTEISETYANYWQPDGIHVRPEFYPYWARNLIVGIIRDEMETELS